MTKENIITHQMLVEWNACEDGYKRFCELFPDGADLKTASDGLIADGHFWWAVWLYERCRDRGLYPEVTAMGVGNAGNSNAGNSNAGNSNAGNRNAGNRNAGNWNAGNSNAGNWNAGNWNAGNRNAGNWNAGNSNAGNWNAGNWNAGNRNAGNFNTNTPKTIMVFDKPCEVEVWEESYKPCFLFFGLTVWVEEEKMSDQEKIDNPSFHTMGGYLKALDYKYAFKASWERADHIDRERVRSLPNFDAEVFFEISGIDLR